MAGLGAPKYLAGHCFTVTGRVKGTPQHCHPLSLGFPQQGSPVQGGFPPPCPVPPPQPQFVGGSIVPQPHSSTLPAPTTRTQEISLACMVMRNPPCSTGTACLPETVMLPLASQLKVSMITSSQPGAAHPANVTLWQGLVRTVCHSFVLGVPAGEPCCGTVPTAEVCRLAAEGGGGICFSPCLASRLQSQKPPGGKPSAARKLQRRCTPFSIGCPSKVASEPLATPPCKANTMFAKISLQLNRA
jgi:hypothetical protein